MIDFRNATFIKSAPSLAHRPDGLFDIMFVGRSNVGKSSLINALCSRKDLAFTSSKPGHTRLLNYFNIDNKFYLVDAPGYGYITKGPRNAFAEMMEDYFANTKPKLVIFLFDSRRIPSQEDISFLKYLNDEEIPVLLVITKVDKLNQSERAIIKKNITPLTNSYKYGKYLLTSIKSKNTIDELKAEIALIIGL